MSAETQGRLHFGRIDIAVWASAFVGPLVITAALIQFTHQAQRDYIFFYLALVAIVAVIRGLWPAVACGVVSFLCVDYFFVPPIYTFTIADEQDIVNLSAFLATAVLIGLLASRRRIAQLQAEALARQLQLVHLHGRSVAKSLVEYVHQSLATELILGHRRRNRWMPGDTTSEVIRRLSGVDVHVLRAESTS